MAEWRDDDGPALSRAESLRLLAPGGIGRIVLTRDALPLILPVRYSLENDALTVRPWPWPRTDDRLTSAVHGAVVAVQADHFADDLSIGWTVTVTGTARLSGDGDRTLRVAPRLVWGRALSAVATPPGAAPVPGPGAQSAAPALTAY